MIYALIFLEKIVENILVSYRSIIYTKGRKHLSSFLTVPITLMWIFVASIVLVGVKDDPLKLVFYALGQGVGNYFGALLEEKLASGNSLLYIVLNKTKANKIAHTLRKEGYGVTAIDAKGKNKNKDKKMLMTLCKRKHAEDIKEVIKEYDEHALVIIKNPSGVKGSYVLN